MGIECIYIYVRLHLDKKWNRMCYFMIPAKPNQTNRTVKATFRHPEQNNAQTLFSSH